MDVCDTAKAGEDFSSTEKACQFNATNRKTSAILTVSVSSMTCFLHTRQRLCVALLQYAPTRNGSLEKQRELDRNLCYPAVNAQDRPESRSTSLEQIYIFKKL